MKDLYLNNLSKEIHKSNKEVGWWPENTCIFEKLQMVSTEICEATSGARCDLMDDKLPEYKMERVELVDTLIRGLDIGGKYELEYTDLQLEYPLIGKDKSIGSNHLGITCALTDLAKAIYIGKGKDSLNTFYSAMIGAILECASARGYNLAQPLVDKLDFNRFRKDHKLENRNKKHGKKF